VLHNDANFGIETLAGNDVHCDVLSFGVDTQELAGSA
jgi:hypothetical protein